MLLTFHSVLRKLYTEPSIGRVLPTKFRFIWLLGFREDFLEITRKKNYLWWPCLLTDRDKMSNLYRGPSPSIDASYQVLVYLAKRFQRRRFFRNQPIRNKNGLWWPCLLTDRNEMSNHYRGPFIDASYQVLVHLAKPFQRRRFLKLANQKQELPVAAMFVNGSGQHEQSLERTFHRCFIPGFSSFG